MGGTVSAMANSAPFITVQRDTGEIDKFRPAADRDSDGFAFVSNVATNLTPAAVTSIVQLKVGDARRGDASGGAFNVTAPAPVAGGSFRFRNAGGANNITVVTSGGGDTVSEPVITPNSGGLWMSDGTNWYRV